MSNTIYTLISPVISQDKNKFNFVYQITEISTGMKYIGSKGTKSLNPYSDLKNYKSSSKNKCFKINQKLNPLNYHYEILSYHTTREEAIFEESRLHYLYDVKCNTNYYNKSNQTINGFSIAGKVVVKNKAGKINLINCNDERYLSGEFVHINTGKLALKDKDGNTYWTDKNDPRYLSGELFGTSKNKAAVKDKNGNCFLIDILDERYLSGKYDHVNKNKITVKDKDGNTFQTDKNDPKFLSKEYEHVNKGKFLVKDKDGNIYSVSKSDERYINKEFVGIATNKTAMKDKDGNIFLIDKNDPKFLSKEYEHVNKNKISVKDKNGNTFQIDKNDERYINGSVIGITGHWYKINNVLYSKKEVIAIFNISVNELIKRCKSDLIEWNCWIIIK